MLNLLKIYMLKFLLYIYQKYKIYLFTQYEVNHSNQDISKIIKKF